MGDPFHQAPHGAFLSALDWLDRPGEVIRNLINGNPEGSGRQLADFLSGPLRALIPGDQSNWELSRPEDYVHGSDLLGIDKKEHPWLGMGADIGGDFLTDPLSLLSFGSMGAAREAAGVAGKAALEGADVAANAAKAAEAGKNGGVALKIPFTDIGTPYAFQGQRVDPLSMIGQGLRKAQTLLPDAAQAPINNAVLKTKSFFGWLKANPAADAALAKASAARTNVAGAGKQKIASMLTGVSSDLADRLVNIIDQPDINAATPASRISPIADQIESWKSRIDAVPDLNDVEKQTLKGVAEQYGQFSHQQWQEAHQDFPAFQQAMKKEPIDVNNPKAGFKQSPLYDISKESPTDYIPRKFKSTDAETPDLLSQPSSIKARKLTDPKAYADYLAQNPDVERDTNFRDLLTNRAGQQGSLAERASIGKFVGGDDFKNLTDPASITAVNDKIKAMRASDPETAMLLDAKFNGIPAPSGIEKGISAVNRLFKQSAVAGAGLMKVSSITRNTIGHPGQLAMTEGMGGQAFKQLLATPQTWWQGFKSGLEKYIGKQIPGDAISSDIQLMRDAAQHADGRFSNGLKWLEDQGRTDLADGLRHGVIDAGFTNQKDGPDILKWAVMNGLKKMGVGPEGLDRAHQFLEAPGAGFTGSENYARTKTFQDLQKGGMSADEAAAKQREAFYNYGTQTKENRLFRSIVPFGAFTSGAIKQGAGGISRNLAMNDVLNPLFGQNDTGPVPSFVSEQMRMPLGQGPDGHDHYLSGFAQPLETLNEIPNLTGAPLHEIARELQRTGVASSAPVLKTAYGLVTGKDPYFDTPYGSYDRIPFVGEAGVPGRVYNAVAGTGLIQPIDALLRTLDHPTDSRHSPAERAIESLTGAHVLDVDPQQAQIQQMQDLLNNDVNAHPVSDFWTKDPETEKKLREYRQLKAIHAKEAKKAKH